MHAPTFFISQKTANFLDWISELLAKVGAYSLSMKLLRNALVHRVTPECRQKNPIEECLLRHAPLGYQCKSRPYYRFLKLSKWRDTFWIQQRVTRIHTEIALFIIEVMCSLTQKSPLSSRGIASGVMVIVVDNRLDDSRSNSGGCLRFILC